MPSSRVEDEESPAERGRRTVEGLRPGAVMLETLCRLLLPRDVWRENGPELLAFWRAMAREPRYRGPAGRIRYRMFVLGDLVGTALRTRARRIHVRRMGGEMGTAVRTVLRGFRRNPLFGGVAVGTLALGLAASTAVFSVTWGVLVAPLPFPDAHELVALNRVADRVSSIAWPDFRDWREASGDYLPVAAYHETSVTLQWDGGARSIPGQRVSWNLFDVLRVRPALGRAFTPEEEAFDGAESVLLSHDLWVRQFGADPGLLNEELILDGKPVPVVGVMPEGFVFPDPDTEYWLPMHEDRALVEAGLPAGTRDLSFLSVVGRTVGDADAALERFSALTTRVDEAHPRDGLPGPVEPAAWRDRLVGDVRLTLTFLLASAVLVLVVAASNVAALALSRADVREREFQVRSAMGAGRGVLWAQLMGESLVLATLAAGVGIPVAAWLLRVLLSVAPPGLPRLTEIHLGLPSLLFAALMALATGALFGLPAAVKAARSARPTGFLRSGRATLGGGTRVQQLMVSGQVGLTVVLLIGATLLVRSYRSLTGEELGFEPEAVVSALVQLPPGRFDAPAARNDLYGRILDAVRSRPGVVSASSTYSPPMAANDLALTVLPEAEDDDDQARWASTVIIRPDYFKTLEIPFVAGRDFGPGDVLGAPLVAIVNETMAREFWPGEDPIGRRFSHTGGMRGSLDGFEEEFFPSEPYTVVGVVGDMRNQAFSEEAGPLFYRPHAQLTWGTQFLLVKVRGNPAAVASALPDIVWDVEPGLPVDQVRTLSRVVTATAALPRFRTTLVTVFAGVTGLLALAGLYGVTALRVARRRREMGLRLALGATRNQLLAVVLRDGMRLSTVGAVVGCAVAFAAAGALETFLYGVRPTAWVTYALVSLSVVVAALGASYLPAARAGRVDPVESLAGE